MELIVGNIAFSTWSLRPWLVLKRCGADFTTTEVPLYGPDSARLLAQHSPTGKVPVLKVEGETIWDSMAISVWASEMFPDAALWPSDRHARWLARSVACEMHSSFMALRTECGMGPDAGGVIHTMVGPDRAPTPTSEAVAADVRRLVEIIRTMRGRFGAAGPYLFGEWSMPDAFLTPVATRFRHYQFDLSAFGDDGTAASYVAELLRQPDFLEWTELAATKQP
ncbi:glutathione S-transferase [Brevundimonas subvibrioides]|uniref:Glutathione S-transferase domain protein n=1 Tax=Brevundimonas subvibrioides (strain ATCC 15264 / DSM 4735 / LMG 14903 / NBRC 16000 / CB 81) TaxID=633149 RepID=D9QFR8_BRESC|nr:glutathione S-transferase [Brevundimonas subvibrioides]ADL00632.1 Glutathione S-transferase domain protein [Brevundimonas subvibrioides ATCC 15264]